MDMEYLVAKIDELHATISTLLSTVETLRRTSEEQAEVNLQLKETVQHLQQTIAEKDAENAELKRQLGMNSGNSSKPPSSDGYKKKSRSLRQSSGKKPGREKGHKGSFMEANLEQPDEIRQQVPSVCENCPNREQCLKSATVNEARYVVDVTVKTHITEYDAMKMPVCPMGKALDNPAFPENVKANRQYGPNLNSFVAALSTVGAVSADHIHGILGNVFSIQLSTGTIMNMVDRAAKAVQPALSLSKKALQASQVGNFDETGLRVDNKLRWVHSSSDASNTYLTLHDKRGKEGMDANGILPEFEGVAVHDCWSPYWYYRVQHALCGAHLQRELKGVMENNPDQRWAPQFFDLLSAMKHAKDSAIASGQNALNEKLIEEYEAQYDELLRLGHEENPFVPSPKKRGRKKKGKTLSLIERLEKYKGSVCLFIHNFAVPFTNNAAERSVRPCKVKIKVAGCFRTKRGANNYLDVMSYLDTARKRGHNPFRALNDAILGRPCLIFT